MGLQNVPPPLLKKLVIFLSFARKYSRTFLHISRKILKILSDLSQNNVFIHKVFITSHCNVFMCNRIFFNANLTLPNRLLSGCEQDTPFFPMFVRDSNGLCDKHEWYVTANGTTTQVYFLLYLRVFSSLKLPLQKTMIIKSLFRFPMNALNSIGSVRKLSFH